MWTLLIVLLIWHQKNLYSYPLEPTDQQMNLTTISSDNLTLLNSTESSVLENDTSSTQMNMVTKEIKQTDKTLPPASNNFVPNGLFSVKSSTVDPARDITTSILLSESKTNNDSDVQSTEKRKVNSNVSDFNASSSSSNNITMSVNYVAHENISHSATKSVHFKGIVQNVVVSNQIRNPYYTIDDQDLIDEGPFGSALWRDQKYLVSILIPIGVGITGAMIIIVMAYATRECKRNHPVAPIIDRTVMQPNICKPDDLTLLDQSTDDEC